MFRRTCCSAARVMGWIFSLPAKTDVDEDKEAERARKATELEGRERGNVGADRDRIKGRGAPRAAAPQPRPVFRGWARGAAQINLAAADNAGWRLGPAGCMVRVHYCRCGQACGGRPRPGPVWTHAHTRGPMAKGEGKGKKKKRWQRRGAKELREDATQSYVCARKSGGEFPSTTARRGRGGRAWLRGHFPHNEFTISRCAAGAQCPEAHRSAGPPPPRAGPEPPPLWQAATT